MKRSLASHRPYPVTWTSISGRPAALGSSARAASPAGAITGPTGASGPRPTMRTLRTGSMRNSTRSAAWPQENVDISLTLAPVVAGEAARFAETEAMSHRGVLIPADDRILTELPPPRQETFRPLSLDLSPRWKHIAPPCTRDRHLPRRLPSRILDRLQAIH